MKKHLSKFWFMGAIALVGSIGLTACSDKDDPSNDGALKTNKETREVPVQLVVSVSTGSESAETRQSLTTVQRNDNFRGISDAILVTMHNTKNFLSTGEASTADNFTKTLRFPTLINSSALDPAANINGAATSGATYGSKRILDVSLPSGTNSVLFYGRATRPTTYDKAVEGSLIFDVSGTGTEGGDLTKASSLQIRLEPRINTQTDIDLYTHTTNLAAAIFNRIMSSEVTDAAAANETFNKTITAFNGGVAKSFTFVGAQPAITWKELGDKVATASSTTSPTTTDIYPLEEILGKAFNNIAGIGGTEIRAGSSQAICRMIYDIHEILRGAWAADAVSDEERNVQRLVYYLYERINDYFTINESTREASFKGVGSPASDGDIAYNLVTKAGYAASDFTATNGQFNGVTDDMLKGYPSYFKLPWGAAQLVYNYDSTTGTGTFAFADPDTSLLTGASTFSYKNYMYPAEIAYYTNSALRTSEKDGLTADAYPDGTSNWITDTKWATADKWVANSVVTADTRAVAVQQNIQYGVALLKSNVKFGSVTSGKYLDNRGQLSGGTDTDQALTTAELGLHLTGIIIGGQSNYVDWQYLPVGGSYDIYDSDVKEPGYTAITVPTTAGTASYSNYTVVLDNYVSGNTQDKVKIALEFTNGTQKEFWGRDNLVRKGGTFYLVGELDPAAAANLTSATTSGTPQITWEAKDPRYHQIPPLDGDGYSTQVPRVFIQDYMTEATFYIGEKSLQNAYVTVPDLRSSQLSLGLSVDLQWKQGLVFEDILLGGN